MDVRGCTNTVLTGIATIHSSSIEPYTKWWMDVRGCTNMVLMGIAIKPHALKPTSAQKYAGAL